MWNARVLEVVRTGNHHQRGVFQLSGDQTGIRNRPHADRHVIAFTDEIDVAIADMRLDLHRRKASPKCRQQRQDPVMGIGGGNADAQGAGRLLLLTHDLALGLDQLRQRLATFLVIPPTTVGQFDAAGGAGEQPHAQAFLHARYRTAHGCRRHASHQRGGGKAASLGSQTKQFDAAQWKIVELSLHD